MSINLNNFNSSDELTDSFLKEIIFKLETAILEKGKAVLLVSGGNTPKLLFEKLSLANMSWEKVKIGLVDERWVDESNNDSNAKLVKEYLLKNNAKQANFIPLYQKNKKAYESQELCSKIVEKEFFPCDVLILGMGDDSHTASLFPNNDKLNEGLNLENKSYCVSMIHKTAPHFRMSLTLSAILKAENIYLHIQGKNKKEVYEKALKEEDFFISPISAVLKNEKKQIKVYYNE